MTLENVFLHRSASQLIPSRLDDNEDKEMGVVEVSKMLSKRLNLSDEFDNLSTSSPKFTSLD